MKFLSLALAFTAVQTISACGRIYGSMHNDLTSDSYETTMFDNCQDRCSGKKSGSSWSQQSKIDMPCNSGYSLQMYFNGQQAFYTTGWGKTHLYMPVTSKRKSCGHTGANGQITLYCTEYKYDCWAFVDNCTDCGGWSSGSKRCKAWDAMSRSVASSPNYDPNPEWVQNKTLVNIMVKNGSIILEGFALEVYNYNQKLAKGASPMGTGFNLTALREKYFGDDKE